MLDIRLFGNFRKFADDTNPSSNSILRLEEKLREQLKDLILRIGIKLEELGEVFINGKVAELSDYVPFNARVGIFPLGMHLLCGGQHLKGHGYITKKPNQSQNYWQSE